ncbi:Nn.00g089230.m01.CDS01 [Neocucurbitaria sp. VM-36]
MAFNITFGSPNFHTFPHNHSGPVMCDDQLSLKQKLDLVDRAQSLKYFEELLECKLRTPEFQQAAQFLSSNCFCAGNRSEAVRLAANVLWPHSLKYSLRVVESREFAFLDNTGSEVIALVLIDKACQTIGDIPTVTLAQGHEKHKFRLRSTYGLYELFNALLDSEIAFKRRQSERENPSSPDGMYGKNENRSGFESGEEDRSVTTTAIEQEILNRVQALVQSPFAVQRARQKATTARRISSCDNSIGRFKGKPLPSSLRSELIASETDIHFVDWTAGTRRAPPTDLISRKPKAMVIVRLVLSCHEDKLAIKKMLAEAISFVDSRNWSLAVDLRDLHSRIFTPQVDLLNGDDHDRSMRDEIRIVTSKKPCSIKIFVRGVDPGVEKWIITINYQRGTHSKALAHSATKDRTQIQ